MEAAAQVGLFDAIMGKPLTLEELSNDLSCDLRVLWTVTEELIALDYLEYQDSKVKLTEEAYEN
ncbi:hypothetical protein GGQ84_002494 [Desulfitispora alkaliphila]|uniref:hypothetical protein n=1 Tax=Desulfitispora alkaliphila TaxID=622674 RepID=UPI003D1D2119